MKQSPLGLGVLIVCACASPIEAVQARELSFEDRVRSQLAIERVYYAHQIGAMRPFEEAVPLDLVEQKVASYLHESQILEQVEHTPITAEMLQAELSRMLRQTRMPGRLREIFAALGDDPLLIRECLVRPALIHRLSNGSHGGQAVLIPGLLDDTVPGRACLADDTWLPPIATSGAPSGRIGFSAVWTGSLMIIWGGAAEPFQAGTGELQNTGGRYDPALDSWTPTGLENAPSPRGGAMAVWTGSEMLVWGGGNYYSGFDNGGRYNPERDTWAPISTTAAPAPGNGLAFWTGRLMLIWRNGAGAGGRYDPQTDTWTPMSTIDQPPFAFNPAGVWTGHEMIIWGGDRFEAAGGRYDPVADHWFPTTGLNAPEPRDRQSAVWTGHEMIVWGGEGNQEPGGYTYFNNGGRYDPVSDSWRPLATIGAPPGRIGHSAVWTGDLMLIWGGTELFSIPNGDGARYSPATDSWSPLSGTGPIGRVAQAAMWTGDSMLIWGGKNDVLLNSGGEYCACEAGTFFLDADGDGYGDSRTGVRACGQPAGYVTDGSDCDDGNAIVHPGASELCNGIDDDCNGIIDDQTAPSASCNDGDPCTTDFCQASTCAHGVGALPKAYCIAEPSTLSVTSRGRDYIVTARLINQCTGLSLDATRLSPFYVSAVSSQSIGIVTLPTPDAGPACTQDGIWETVAKRRSVAQGGVEIHFQTPSDGLCATLDGNRQDILDLLRDVPRGEGARVFLTSSYPDSATSLQCSVDAIVNQRSQRNSTRDAPRRPLHP